MEHYHIREQQTAARTILSRTSGFIAQAGFTHSLNPARNCTYGCTYCYVPTMRIQAGLQPEDWRRWGQFTTFKSNAAALAQREVTGTERIYCSPLVDPYQPAEQSRQLMPPLLEALAATPPQLFTIQTRSPLITRDLAPLAALARRTQLRVSFSLTTDDDAVRRRYEPHCAPLEARLEAIAQLRAAGIRTFATLAPLLPCNPEALAGAALAATAEPIILDPLHTRATKKSGATTRPQAERVSAYHGWSAWHDPRFQQEVLDRIAACVRAAGRECKAGPEGFALLAATTAATTR